MTILNARYADAARSAILISTVKDGDVFVQTDLLPFSQENAPPMAEGDAPAPQSDQPFVTALVEWMAAGGQVEPFVPEPPIQAPKVLSRPDFVVALTTVPNPPIFDEAEALQALETFPPKFRAALAGRPLAYQAAAIEAWRETKTVARDAPLFLDLLAFYAAAAGLSEAQASALGDTIFAARKKHE